MVVETQQLATGRAYNPPKEATAFSVKLKQEFQQLSQEVIQIRDSIRKCNLPKVSDSCKEFYQNLNHHLS